MLTTGIVLLGIILYLAIGVLYARWAKTSKYSVFRNDERFYEHLVSLQSTEKDDLLEKAGIVFFWWVAVFFELAYQIFNICRTIAKLV